MTNQHANENAVRRSKPLSPMSAGTERQILSLRRDNTSAGDFWMLADGCSVTVCAQKLGEAATESVTIPRAEFNRLIRWYTRPQAPLAKAAP